MLRFGRLDKNNHSDLKRPENATQKLPKNLHLDLSSTQKDTIEFLLQNPNASRVEIASQLSNINELKFRK